MKAWAWAWVLLAAPAASFFTQRQEDEPGMRHLVEAINRVGQVLETHERHMRLYERVSLLEESLAEKTQRATLLQAEVTQLRAKIPELEAEIETIPEMRKELAEFEAKIEKLVHDYEAKLSTLASEVIRLKKYGSWQKDLQTLSDGSNVMLRQAPSCPEVGQGMVGERVGEQCLYFSFGVKLNWTTTHHHCQEMGGDMAVPQDLHPLKLFLHQAFTRGPSLWLGSSYDLSDDDDDNDEGNDRERKFSRSNSETNSTVVANPNLIDTLQADGAGGYPEGGTEGTPQKHFSLQLNGGQGDEDEGDGKVLGPAGSLRGVIDQVPMFREDLMARYGSLSVPNKAHEDLPVADEASDSDNSVVAFVLLTESSDDQRAAEVSGVDMRSLAPNQTAVDESSEEHAVSLQDGAASRESKTIEGPGTSGTQGTGKVKENRKARMRCMLLQQMDSEEYEVVGRPCNELHNFVCDFKVTFDNLLHE